MAEAKPKATEPKASRPYMPGYGILDANEGSGLLPWEWAEQRLAASKNYWIATTWPDGRPHCTAVWAIWMDGAVYFSAGWKSRKAKNLSANPRIVICPENADHAVSLEGVAETTDDAATIERFCTAYSRKYHWDLTPTWFASSVRYSSCGRSAYWESTPTPESSKARRPGGYSRTERLHRHDFIWRAFRSISSGFRRRIEAGCRGTVRRAIVW